jgi:hypothetical protein
MRLEMAEHDASFGMVVSWPSDAALARVNK